LARTLGQPLSLQCQLYNKVKMTKNIRLTIGEFSRFCQVTVKTLRHYERMKLLVPHEVDEWTQ